MQKLTIFKEFVIETSRINGISIVTAAVIFLPAVYVSNVNKIICIVVLIMRIYVVVSKILVNRVVAILKII